MPKTSTKPKINPPRFYPLNDTGLPIARSSWYRYAAAGLIPALAHIAGKTLVHAAVVDAIASGQIKLPANPGHLKPPKPRSRQTKAGA